MNESPSLQFEDIQGFAIRGFGKLPYAAYLLCQIESPTAFKAWLANALDTGQITPATVRGPADGVKQAIAFTASGLQNLIGEAWSAEHFPQEFIEGMVQEQRSRLLGDVLQNAPEHWRWGNNDSIDLLLISAAASEAELDQALATLAGEDHGLVKVSELRAQIPSDGKEPFGFADGISQPILTGTDRETELYNRNTREHRLNAVAAGEFVLGYPDGTGNLPRSPAVSPAADSSGHLRPHHEQPELRDFGHNGCFVVMRQLAQDVAAFNTYIEANQTADIDLAAKMVGRSKSGETLASDKQSRSDNDFDYVDDLKGLGCPLGSHVRRTNPRSTVHASSQQGSLNVTNRHRILRRGRVYQQDDGETGLLFLCLNASINRQFEFVQSTWSNDPFFQGLAGEVDPIIGTQRPRANQFAVPRQPYRYQCQDLQQWVTVKGGAYFFLPALSSLAMLAEK